MKFGLYLEQNSVIEWKEFYINYKILKKILKIFETNFRINSIISFKNKF